MCWIPAQDRWAIVHNICHLRDLEQEGYAVRIHRILSEENPWLLDLDGSQLAIERDYVRQNAQEGLVAFRLSRRQNVARLKEVRFADLERSGQLENTGRLTLGGLIVKLRDHDRDHLKELRTLRGAILKRRAVG